MSPRTRRAPVRRVLTRLAAVAVGLVLTVGLTAPAYADNRVTPGDFTGYGFDQCLAPGQQAMDRWREYSPFWAVGIYISGDSRGCRTQPNLTPTWIATQLGRGWRLLPITLGPQAACNPRFPRYGDDPTIKTKPGTHGGYRLARRQGRAEADTAVAAATRLGIVPGSTLWYDLEGFDVSRTRCRESALAFLSGWTAGIHGHGYVSGVYSSAGSGIKMLDDARVDRPDAFHLPDRIWIARWDGVADVTTSYIRDDGWLPGNRMKQYRGGHDETWGGVRINIDRNYLDLGRGSVAPGEVHCGGIGISFPGYERLEPSAATPEQVKALKCLLKEKGIFTGALGPTYGDRLLTAVHAWQESHSLPVSDVWTRKAWRTVLADGPRGLVKIGSAGLGVRRLQRTLNATGRVRLRTSGVFDAATDAAVRQWQASAKQEVTGVLTGAQWLVLQTGRR